MQQILKRLELIKTAIVLEDEEIIEMQIAKLDAMECSDEITQIMTLLKANNFSQAALDIHQYIDKFTGVTVYEDKATQGLKLELKVLEQKLEKLNTLKSEYLHDIDEFNTQYHIKLGDIIEKILLKQKELAEKAFRVKEEAYEELEKTYEETQEVAEEIEATLSELKKRLDEIDESHQDYDELQEVYETLQEEYDSLQESLKEQKEELEQEKQTLEDDPTFEEWTQAKNKYEEFFSDYENVKETADDIAELNASERKKLKKLFRKASRLCHPDLVVEELRVQAHEIMQELNSAYSRNDLPEVKRILLSLENGTEFTVASDKVNDSKILKNIIENLREKILVLETDIENIKEDETFKTIQEIDDREVYFEALAKAFEEKYNALRGLGKVSNPSKGKKTAKKKTVKKKSNTKEGTYLSTSTIGRKFDIQAKPFIFDKLLELELLYREDNHYKLSKKGKAFGGKYRKDDKGGKWVVWEEHSLDAIVKDLKNSFGFVSNEVQTLTPHQDDVFEQIVQDIDSIFNNDYEDNRISLSGSAGVGKTFMTIKIIEHLQALNYDVIVTAPTHKALSVITDNFKKYGIQKVKAKTLHAFLNLKPQIDEESGEKIFLPDIDKKNADKVDVLIVDESSMIGADLFTFINDELKSTRVEAVLFVGDPYQLPPVNSEKNAVFELPLSYRLEQIIRQEANSYIIGIATKIRDCIIGKDFSHSIESFFTKKIEGLTVFSERDEFLAAFYANDGQSWHTKNQIIADYTNDSVNFYNKISREHYWKDKGNLAPKQFEAGDVVVFQDSYMVDKEIKFSNGSVVTIRNCTKQHDAKYNMDYWLCTDEYADNFKVMDNPSNTKYQGLMKEKIDTANNSTKGFEKKNAWTEFYRLKERYANVKFNYASTIHKLQGSTYKTVFIDTRKMTSLYRYSAKTEKEFLYRLLYVAVTRASKDIVVLR